MHRQCCGDTIPFPDPTRLHMGALIGNARFMSNVTQRQRCSQVVFRCSFAKFAKVWDENPVHFCRLINSFDLITPKNLFTVIMTAFDCFLTKDTPTAIESRSRFAQKKKDFIGGEILFTSCHSALAIGETGRVYFHLLCSISTDETVGGMSYKTVPFLINNTL